LASEKRRSPRRRLQKRQTGPLPGIRVIVSGKGGVGKTTVTALLAGRLAEDGISVLAIDADPQEDLAHLLGHSTDNIIPITKNRVYIEEKIGRGGIINLNPDLSDIADRCAVRTDDGISLLVMGTVASAGGGCLCPENTLVSQIVRQVKVSEGEAVLMDTPAGLEHFGRGLGRGFSDLISVSEPNRNALRTACRTAHLASEIGIMNCRLVINKVRDDEEYQTALAVLGDDHPFSIIYRIPYFDGLASSESLRALTQSAGPDVAETIAEIAGTLLGE